jgi:aminoglycoside phosphotransferase (APT) family kinase protein
MKSRTKHHLTSAQITTLVEANFNNRLTVGGIEELKGGMFNSAYRIELVGTQDPLILKVSFGPSTPILTYEKEMMRTEVAVHKLVEAHTTVPVPKLLKADLTRSLVDSNYFFMTELRGQVMSKLKRQLSAANLEGIKRALADYLAQIHTIKGSYFGYFSDDPGRQYPSWREAFLQMVQDILNDGKAHKVRLPYDRIELILGRAAPLLEAVREPALVDFDLWPGNIFLEKVDGTYQIEGIVDFERAFWGDPYADFATMFFPTGDLWSEPAFWEVYLEVRGTRTELTDEAETRIQLYKMYIFLIMAVETYRYGFFYSRLQRKYAMDQLQKSLAALESSLN